MMNTFNKLFSMCAILALGVGCADVSTESLESADRLEAAGHPTDGDEEAVAHATGARGGAHVYGLESAADVAPRGPGVRARLVR